MSKINKLFDSELRVINLGLESFSEELKLQKTEVVHVEWRPVAGGNKKLGNILNQLG
ncbi:fdrA domain protein [Isachenkonia alkalipeptolytica]|uniref:FdrA domain protein n=1 Tax=Isachenkonia alkalipeptolytica TaxID=2565777 RepID=A0AA43XN49_9CLOT|nr:fdrA domain protein [Isachenkonia alkalipeptolytica]NBG89259.1 fdrA domain protein [Isachenkonia alkalipeptolytica]